MSSGKIKHMGANSGEKFGVEVEKVFQKIEQKDKERNVSR